MQGKKKAGDQIALRIPNDVNITVGCNGELMKARAKDGLLLPLEKQAALVIHALQGFLASESSLQAYGPYGAVLTTAIMQKAPEATRRDYVASIANAAFVLRNFGKPIDAESRAERLRFIAICAARLMRLSGRRI